MANGRGVSLIRYARNAQQCGDHRRRHHSKATAANEEGAACFTVFGVFDLWKMLSHGSRPFPYLVLGKRKGTAVASALLANERGTMALA